MLSTNIWFNQLLVTVREAGELLKEKLLSRGSSINAEVCLNELANGPPKPELYLQLLLD